MSRINNTQRADFLNAVLNERFDAKFDVIQNRITEFGKENVAENHPVFVYARQDIEISQYIATSHDLDVVDINNDHFFRPGDYSLSASKLKRHWSVNDGFKTLKARCEYPSYRVECVVIINERFLNDYSLLWAEYTEAQKTLRDLIYSYSTTEKFDKDFPELVKYLPRTTPVTSLAVPVSDFKMRLSAMGIPPVASE